MVSPQEKLRVFFEDYLRGIRSRWNGFLSQAHEILTNPQRRKAYLVELLQSLFPPWSVYVSLAGTLWLFVAFFFHGTPLPALCLISYIFILIVTEWYDIFKNQKKETPMSSYLLVIRVFPVLLLLTICYIANYLFPSNL